MEKKKDEITIRSSAAEYLTYVASVGDQQDSIEMRYEDENIWLTQKMMATLYDVDVRTINEHIKKIYSDSELEEDSTIRNFRIVQTEGSRQVTRDTKHYNLQMIIAVGFKVNSERAVQFRKWVNQIAKDYTIKGWVMDDERLKRGAYLTEKYFDEQLERIREIRASERMFYQKITDLYATAIDYDKNAATTRRFYATVQNKMHYAVHGHTAAELIVERANHTKEHMGLTTWADAPDGKIKKSDVTVAKNYLSQDEMKQLNRMVTAYLDFAENMTLRHIPLTMQDWEKRLNSFIEMFDYGILQDAGKVSAEIAKLHAETEFEKYRVIQDIQDETGLAYLFIAHDLSMVKYISDRIGVLHLGYLLETGTTEEIFSHPVHPYTRSLISAIPNPNPVVERSRIALHYDYKTSGLDYGAGTMHQIEGTHFVRGTDADLEKWV